MRGFRTFMVVCASGLSAIVAVPATAQIDTYRPGSPYSAVPARAADQCVSACSGDAACRGWNFVTIREGAAICEFLSRDALPMPSAGSVSGVSAHVSGASSRLVRTQPSPTVRVGQPAPVKREVRAVPKRKAVRPATTGRVKRRVAAPTPQAQVRPHAQARPHTMARPRFRHALDGGPIVAAPVRMPQALPSRPPIGAPVMAAAPSAMPTASAVSPFAARPQEREQVAVAPPPGSVAPMSAPVAAPVSGGPDGLFGSLYDDVAVPSALDVSTLTDGAPIATATTVKVAPATVKGLAGG